MWQSSGGRQETVAHRPPPKPFVPGLKSASTEDHNGERVHITWMAKEGADDLYAKGLPPYPFQVYVLNSAKGILEDHEFPSCFVKWIDHYQCLRDPHMDVHFEFYMGGFNNVLSCTAHQQREIESRNRNAIWPRLVANQARRPDLGYQGVILVIDRDNWYDNGIVVVTFGGSAVDGVDHDQLGGDETVLWAERMYAPGNLRGNLASTWTEAGGTWAQSSLNRHNDGGVSPALYPAVDPSAHHDVEHEDNHDNIGVSNQPVESSSETDPVDDKDLQPQHLEVSMADLLKTPRDLEGLTTSTYSGHSGWETTSVWKASLSKTRPPFAFTLYLASDNIPIAAEALFACFDRELLSTATWILDIVRNVPDIQSASHHYSHEKRHRTPEKTANRRKWARMLVRKVCASKLPEELAQHIEDMMVPPPCSNYSAPPDRLFHDMFMYLDASRQLTGPQIVYSNHFQDDIDPDVQRRRRHKEPVLKMHVTDLRSWRLVSDELHIVWSLCSPRLKIPPEDLPHYVVRLDFPQVCTVQPRQDYRDFGEQWPREAQATMELRGTDGPIVMYDAWTFDDEFWYTALEIKDVETDTTIPLPPMTVVPIDDQRGSSWSEDLLMRSCDPPDDEDGGVLRQISSRKDKINRRIIGRQEWWLAMYESGGLKDGHEYVVGVKKGWGARRWTYGTVPGLKGPYNLPPIPVYGENECRFKVVITEPREMRDRSHLDNPFHESDDSEDSSDESNHGVVRGNLGVYDDSDDDYSDDSDDDE
ncbi:hypothetical protein PRZ48_008160 [Zasmidium cellare]|uniref:Uncharacterized protein n=1 Tax=Zasmidium cellare TaxID=395010 RepID=A0ABR0EEN7_ZASCE|nr:hypothetical protein PRZ48_008160 [Zasmidium cellare]